jgi:xylulokinase
VIRVTLGVDIGTGSSKGVLVTESGAVVATATREHRVSTPQPGHAEMDPDLWWTEFVQISRECTQSVGDDYTVVAIGVSGMGPCVAIADDHGSTLRPAILYGIDTRAASEIASLTALLGDKAIQTRTGSALSTQAVGPKLSWLRTHEPALFARARRFYMPSSWLVAQLTGEYVLDHHSASQCNPLYDRHTQHWISEWASLIAPEIVLPRLMWPGDVAGTVTASASAMTGITAGTPVIAGTVDAWAEAVSVNAQNIGDLMLMYGTTMFLVATVDRPLVGANVWGTNGAYEGTHSLAGGMATSGAITSWLRDLFGDPSYEALLREADSAGPGAGGLLMLPYFAGERTPIADPGARGVIVGLSTSHTRGHLYRSALEATAFGVRHNVEALRAAGASIERIVAVGGGTQGTLWPQIVSDITGLVQQVPTITIGASYGVAYLAARIDSDVCINEWNPVKETLRPRLSLSLGYDQVYEQYLELYSATRQVVARVAQSDFEQPYFLSASGAPDQLSCGEGSSPSRPVIADT